MGSYGRCDRRHGFLRYHGSIDSGRMVTDVLVIAASMVGGFIFAALLSDGNVDDDDNGPDGGLMTPAYVPNT